MLTRFDLFMQCDISFVAELIFGLGKDFDNPKELEAHLKEEIEEEKLQRINQAALREGHHPLSFSSRQ